MLLKRRQPVWYSQTTTTVGFSYDDANRRSTLTLSNGVNVSYSYDNDSRVTGITYKFNANTLGDLTYTYDELGRRTLVGGSFARTGLPGAVASATYDAANELTNWNGVPISYDLNGNMLSDGFNAFTWNARNQVASLNGRNLQYDAYGRRIQNSLGTAFLYDGANAAQELSGTTPTANLLSGGIDEWFGRADLSGTVTPLQDALGSTIALVDGTGNVATSYSYDPFGNTAVSGVLSSNPSLYTGRENEGNGLYYYRARYVETVYGRFISEDPLNFAGGDANLYGYTRNNPINFADSTGLRRDCPVSRMCEPVPKQHLTDCAKAHLQPYFSGLNLDSVEFISGIPIPTLPGVEAITLGGQIAYEPGWFPGTASGLGNIGHELEHVSQQQHDSSFLTHYFWGANGWFRNLLRPGDAYRNIPAEQAAFATGDRIEYELAGRYSLSTICESTLQ